MMNTNTLPTSSASRPDMRSRNSSDGANPVKNTGSTNPSRRLSPTSTLSPSSSYTTSSSSSSSKRHEHHRSFSLHLPRSRSKSPRPPPPSDLSIITTTTANHSQASSSSILPGQQISSSPTREMRPHSRHRSSDSAIPTSPAPPRSATAPMSPDRQTHKRDSWIQKKSRNTTGPTPGGYGRHGDDWLFGGISIRETVKEIAHRRRKDDEDGRDGRRAS